VDTKKKIDIAIGMVNELSAMLIDGDSLTLLSSHQTLCDIVGLLESAKSGIKKEEK